MADDEELFRQEMAGVKPLKQQPKIALKKNDTPKTVLKARRAAAQNEVAGDSNPLSDNEIALLDPYYFIEYKRPGVQNGVYRKLKQGKYQQEARLDLHGMTVAEARREVFDFIQQSYHYGLRTLIIIHGKGHSNKAAQAKLKSYVNSWLPELPEVQAFCSAQPQHGGVGAAYVLLAKSEKKKQENRDRITKGRSD
ncbi:DNA endonuclease SmrA [Dasania sp. GY-MA-18]|uniref:DNA endonuclease SmrA n=1 Tax=Dasania phycosphaerae TaxID=2950436 RepID=A0A9J6RJ77_9GAMM|nr:MULTISPECIES: DNA endonuclease SmrA [Dasania]MCR8921593.1 DNA endonuclease SmrA [Dasania sp. GY-MA-18]MCZ0864021.1 DNA endonuclease SmrA [Dasania phycosphaerae]MCZ0867749.1 DNA endonuclease SmrA [Dasania phycosphaerae]